MKYYIGKHSGILPSEKDVGVKYFSSGDKEFRKDQRKNPNDYIYEILGQFKTALVAVSFEIWLHNKFDVGVNPLFYNKAKQTSALFDGINVDGKNNPSSKSVLQVDPETGKVIKEWDYIRQAAEELGISYSGIIMCTYGEQDFCGNFVWVISGEEIPSRLIGRNPLCKKQKPILQLDLETSKLIRRWDCVKQAAKELHLKEGAIRGCLAKRNKSSHGFLWIFESEPIPKFISNKNGNAKVSKKISQLDKMGCIKQAARELGINHSSIIMCAKGDILSAGGFKWKY